MNSIPRHVAIIMDGNGRWAQQRGLDRVQGHAAGEESVIDVIESAADLGIEYLSLFSFSTENWQRPPEEVDFLMTLLKDVAERRLDEVDRQGGRMRLIGRRTVPIPAEIIELIVEAEQKTAHNTRIQVIFAFNYGGRTEIVDAAKKIAAEAQVGKIQIDDIDEQLFARHLYASDVPDVDLLIRTSGEQRISNFMLWQLAYAELVFTDVLWPDFRREHLQEALEEYSSRSRRFGSV